MDTVYISLQELIASYALNYGVKRVTIKELNRWKRYLEQRFSNGFFKVKCGLKEELFKYKRDPNAIANIENKAFILKQYIIKYTLEQIVDAMDECLLTKFIFGIDEFVPIFEETEVEEYKV